jgi:hypothetical protein
MKLPHSLLSLALVFVCLDSVPAQKRQVRQPAQALVVDETLSVLRAKPSLFAPSIQRMRRGRRVQILGKAEADGVTFYRVSALPGYSGWVQSDAVFGRFRADDEERFARLVQAADGFDQIELAGTFLQMYPASRLRPPMLLMYGDLLEQAAVKLSRDATSRLSRREMTASGAPVHSYYLNFNMLDRYRKLGVRFLFNPATRSFHYDGASWKEIVRKYPASAVATEAEKRLSSLSEKLGKSGQ